MFECTLDCDEKLTSRFALEHRYDAYSYSMGMFIAEVPYICLQSIVYVAIAYPLVGFPVNDASSFGKSFAMFFLPFVLYMQMATYFGQFMACVMPSQDAATIVSSLINTVWNIFAGFLIAKDKIPTVYMALYWISPIRYALEPLIMSQYYCDGCAKNEHDISYQANHTPKLDQLIKLIEQQTNQTIGVRPDFPTVLDSTCDKSCTIFEVTTPQGLQLPVYASDFATAQFGFEYDAYWRDVFVILAFVFTWRILCTLTLRYVNHQKR